MDSPFEQSWGYWTIALDGQLITMISEGHPGEQALPLFKSRFDAEEFLANWVGEGKLEDEPYAVVGSERPWAVYQLLEGAREGCTHVSINPPLDRREFSLFDMDDFMKHFEEYFSGVESDTERDPG